MCVRSRPPTPAETEQFLRANPQFKEWTFGKIMAGGLKSVNICKMTLRGQAYDALQCSTRTLDALIRCDAIPGMEKIPLEGGDANADDEIATCMWR